MSFYRSFCSIFQSWINGAVLSLNSYVDMLKMQGKLSDRTPLFIVNGDIDKQSAWGKDFHQIDVFTTLLDILNIDSKWKGLGHTLLNPHYKSSVDATSYRVSEWIINGDYFPSRK